MNQKLMRTVVDLMLRFPPGSEVEVRDISQSAVVTGYDTWPKRRVLVRYPEMSGDVTGSVRPKDLTLVSV